MAGAMLRDFLERHSIDSIRGFTAGTSTGRALIIRDANDVRLVVNSDYSANHALSVTEVDDYLSVVSSCTVLFVSGYALSRSESPCFAAIEHLMCATAQASKPRPVTVFDVVPHRLYERMTFERFRELTAGIDILVSEVATMRRFLSLGARTEEIDDAMARDAAVRLAAYYSGLVLRFGPSGCDRELLRDSTGREWMRDTGHASSCNKVGFGDRMLLSALEDFFGVLGPRTN
jgi:sugar/nucleoside kinase (ribokinase family)